MDARQALKTLSALGLASVPAIIVGWDRGWVTNLDVVKFAADRFTDNSEPGPAIVSLLGADAYSDDEVRRLLVRAAGQFDTASELDKWRLAYLLMLREADVQPSEKVEQLEQLYATFGYPHDMRLCSPYRASAAVLDELRLHGVQGFEADLRTDPLEGMSSVIEILQ
jgi:hypothetical protein